MQNPLNSRMGKALKLVVVGTVAVISSLAIYGYNSSSP